MFTLIEKILEILETIENDHTKHESNSKKHKLSENDIIAQSVLFFAAGFETTASTLTNCVYELAKNPEVQEKLYAELNHNLADFSVDEPIESQDYFDIVVNQSPYLDAVIK